MVEIEMMVLCETVCKVKIICQSCQEGQVNCV